MISGELLPETRHIVGLRLSRVLAQCFSTEVSRSITFLPLPILKACLESPFVHPSKARRLVPGGIAWYGVPCSSWVFMSFGGIPYNLQSASSMRPI